MAELIFNWLNDEIQLSKRVTNFEEDFHNGFLFGQLLSKYSQQLNFHEFINKDDKASRMKNFSLLLETFTDLRVGFTANTAYDVINKKIGVAKKLLYELKMQLQRTNDNAASKSSKLAPLKKIQQSKQKYDLIQKQHFVKQLNELHPAQKQIIEHQLLKKYSDFHLTSNLKASQADEKEKQLKFLHQKKFYERQRDNIHKSEQFSKQWEAEGRQKWANNMTVRQIQISKDTQFKHKQMEQRAKSKQDAEASALRSMGNDISEFERKRKLEKGIEPTSSDEEEEPRKESVIKTKPEVIGSPLLEAREQRRLPNFQTEKKKHQRQKRRRKMIVEQMKKYQLIEITRRQRCIIATIEQTSKQQKEIQYQIWRAWQNKHIIIENKAIQTEKIKEKDQTRSINAKFKKDQLLKTFRQEHKKEVDATLSKMTQLERVHQARSRKGVYSECEKMVLKLLEITEKMYVSAQERNSEALDQSELQAQFVKFISETPDAEESSLKLKHYIEGSHEWNISITRPEEEVSTNPKDDNSLPNETVNNFYLGNILKTVFQKYYKNSLPQNVSPSDRLVISLLGLQFSRKHQVAKVLAEKDQFEIIQVQKLIQQKLQDWMDFQAKNIQISKQTNQIAVKAFSGQEIDEKIIISLVSEEIQKHKKAILLDYPNTYEQAIELCRLISGVEPHDLLEKDKLTKKIEDFSRLVKPNDPKIIERQTKGCGIDFVWWINVSAENSFDRMLGRRWINDQVVNVYDEIDPDIIKEGEKASSLAMRNHFKLKNKLKLQDWFSLFGIKIQEENITQKCWETVEGNINSEELLDKMIQKVKEAQQIKEKEKLQLAKLEDQKKKQQAEREKLEQEKQVVRQKCIRSNPQNLKEQLSLALGKVDIQKTFIDQIAEVWNKIEITTINSFKKVFQSLSEQQKSKRSYIAHVKRNFIALLTRQDHKFYLIKDFQRNYNEFITANEDMFAFQYTKQELHQRVEDLQNDLLSIVEEKKQDAIAERSSIIGSGWLEAQIDLIYECLYLLIQSQLNRFAVSEKIIIDFYAKKFMCNAKTFEPLSPQINSESYATLEGVKESICPKLDKIISEALRILNREEEVVDDKAKKGGKGAPPKKDDKKAAKKGGKQQIQEVKEPTAEEIEMKGAVNTEKAILRQRLNRIKTLGYRILSETVTNANKLYNELEDLYQYTHKVEQKAVFGLSKIFKKAIENEQKIENEVQIKHVEVVHTELIRNFQKSKPIIQPARETANEDHFTLGSLQQVFRLVTNEAEGQKISTKRLTVLLIKLISNQILRKLIPKSWRSLKSSNVETFVQILDRTNRGYVDLSELFMLLAMTGFLVPTTTEIEEYTLELSNYSSLKEVNLQKFITTKSWFDEQITQQQNIRAFDRNKEIKRVLFGIFQNQDNVVQINSFLSAITLEEIGKTRELKRGTQRYFDAAFA